MKTEKLNILVCENSYPEFKFIADKENFKDINISSFPELCSRKIPDRELDGFLDKSADIKKSTVILCSRYCDILKAGLLKKQDCKVYTSEFCYSHMINKPMYDLCLEQKYYFISTGWLENWEKRIEGTGFNRETAPDYYRQWCSKLVYFDAGIYPEALEKLKMLSDFLRIPYVIIPAELDNVRALLKSVVYEWRLRKNESSEKIKNLQQQTALYASAMEIMTKIAAAEYKRDVIEVLKFTMVLLFGAEKSVYWNASEINSDVPDYIKAFLHDSKPDVQISDNYMLAKISAEKDIGVIEVGDFLFPENISKYMQLFSSVIQIASLAVSNANKYEELQKARNDFEFVSYHDSMTGLKNRNFFNNLSSTGNVSHPAAVFCFDVNDLKTVNDTQGHQEGDKLIISAAGILKKAFRESDYLIRMGGDEFLVIANKADSETASILGKRFQTLLGEYNSANDSDISLSQGFAVSESNKINLDDLINKADKSMYLSKGIHKNNKKRIN